MSLRPGVPFFILYFSIFTLLTGCEAFVRKFTRKPKKDNLPQEEMVLAPEEYKPAQMSKEDVYRKYFLFWKSWQDELIESLLQNAAQNANWKKGVYCAGEALDNLRNLRPLLNEKKQKVLDAYIAKMSDLKGALESDIYGNRLDNNRRQAERIRRNILRDLSYRNSKDYLS